jgi:ferredoxin-NADP reductase
MKNFNFHVLPIGLLDMLQFKKLVPNRQKKLAAGLPGPIIAEYGVNALAAHMHPKAQEVSVAKIIEHSEDIKTYILTGENLAPFRAGQYVSVQLGIGLSQLSRPYSISCSPKWAKEGKYAITVKRAGFASDWILSHWIEGTRVTISGPEGSFYYEPLRDAPHVVGIAGGCGITPFLSMAYAIRDGLEDFRLTLIYGSRTNKGILFKQELDEIAKDCPKVKIVHVISDEEAEGCEQGFITAELIKKHAGNAPCSVYLCGPEAMYAFVEKELAKLAIEKKHIRREVDVAPASPEKLEGYTGDIHAEYTLNVKCFAADFSIPMKASETVLTALERAGARAPSRCRGGECGWCRSRLIEGDVFMPPYLDARRIADFATGHIHPCCAYPLSDICIEIWPE